MRNLFLTQPIIAMLLTWAVVMVPPAPAQQPDTSAEQSGSESAATEQEEAEPEESQAEPGYEPSTTVDPHIPTDQLKVLVKPLTKAELEVEAKAWFELYRQKARQIAAAQLGVKKTNEALKAKSGVDAEEAMKTVSEINTKATEDARAAEEEITERAKQQLGVEEFSSPEEAGEDDPAEGGDPAAAEGDPAEDELSQGDPAEEDSAPGEAADEEPAEEEPGEEEPTAEEAAEEEPAAEDQADEAAPPTDETADAATAKKSELLDNASQLREHRSALGDRLQVVLDSLEAKGGDVEEYRMYRAALSGLDVDATDISAATSTIVGWLTSVEGGQRWAWNVARFLLILFITYVAARLIASVTNWLLNRKVRLSRLAEQLISRTIKNVIFIIGFAISLTALQVDVTPIVAGIGAAGFIVGFALQGTLSNFASGLMILIYRPFDVGDIVTAGGITGVVHEMSLVSTTFRTFDNQTIHVPNNEIWGNVITNITANEIRRVDLEFGIGYGDDFIEAERILREVVDAHELVLDDPEPMVVTHALADSSVNILCRPWVKTSDWWTVKIAITREAKKRFDEAGISIPFPQRDIHVYQHDNEAPV